jgi:hypothetical protein
MAQRATVIREGGSIGTGPGYSDDPSRGSAEHGQHMLGIISREVARFLVEFSRH